MLTTKTELSRNGLSDEPDQLEPVQPQHDPGEQRDEQDRRGGEGEGAARRAGVEVAESGEEQGEEGRRERGPCARSRLLRVVHRG